MEQEAIVGLYISDNETDLDNATFTSIADEFGSSFIAALLILICLSLFSNLLVIFTWLKQSHLHNPANLHIVSLAVADCAVTILIMPVTALKTTNNQRFERLVKGLVIDFSAIHQQG